MGNAEAGAEALEPGAGGFRLYNDRLVDGSKRGARVLCGPINWDMHRAFRIWSEIKFKIVGTFETSDQLGPQNESSICNNARAGGIIVDIRAWTGIKLYK